MKAADFTYARPATLEQALDLLADGAIDSAPLAGGQSLMPMMNFRMAQPERLVDLGGLGDLRGISVSDGEVRIGAMTRYAELMGSAEVAQHLPLMAAALPHVAHSAIRNRGTLGGSLALADPAAEMPAVAVALGARISWASASDSGTIEADAFFRGLYETALPAGALITKITYPLADDAPWGFYELARRHGDYAMAGVAWAAQEAMIDPRVVFFSVSDRPRRARGAEAELTGADRTDPGVHAACAAALADLEPTGDLNADADTKRYLAGVVLTRALRGDAR